TNSQLSTNGWRVDALQLHGAPAWVQVAASDPNVGSEGPDAPTAYGYDAAHDRLLGAPAAWQFPFGSSADCPADMVWWPGTTHSVDYPVTNPDPITQMADWTLEADRDWPGFPITGSMLVSAMSATTIPVDVPVPDTAFGGVALLH